jgi:hypothetical protein
MAQLADDKFSFKLDNNPGKLAFKNGIYDLENNSFKEGIHATDYITDTVPFDYNPADEIKTYFLRQKIKEILLNSNVEERRKAKDEKQKALEEAAREKLLKKKEDKKEKPMRGGGLLDASIPIMKELQSILINKHATIGIIAMEYANNYIEYVKSVKPNVFIKQIISNILIMFLTANVIHCDLHKNNIMVKDGDTGKFVYFIDFGRIYEFNETNPIMKNYKDLLNRIYSLTNILNATGDVEKAYNTNTFTIDPKNYSIFDITEPNMSNPVFPKFKGTERLRNI